MPAPGAAKCANLGEGQRKRNCRRKYPCGSCPRRTLYPEEIAGRKVWAIGETEAHLDSFTLGSDPDGSFFNVNITTPRMVLLGR